MPRHDRRQHKSEYDICACGALKRIVSKMCWECRRPGISASNGYLREIIRGHPLADSVGHVQVHRRVVYDAGIDVPEGFDVHHINGNKQDNRLENLEVVPKGDHTRHHHRVYATKEEQLAARRARYAQRKAADPTYNRYPMR